MQIGNNSVYNAGYSGATWSTAAAKAAQKASSEAADTAVKEESSSASDQKVNQDTFTKTGNDKPVTYSKNQLNSAQVQSLQQAEQARQDSFVKMLQSMVVKQGQKSNLTLFGMNLYVSPEQSAAAAKTLEPGGEYSVDAVAGRIMDMAKALSGGDASKIEELRKAVEKGLKAAGVELGGKLPSISQNTYTEVMKRFDDWANESKKTSGIED